MKKGFWVKKIIGFIVLGAVAVLVLGFVVMSLWNAILPAVLGVKAITFAQALGIFVLSKILFGGFKGGGGGWSRKKQEWKMRMDDKWQTMSSEERQQWKEKMRGSCRTWGKPAATNTAAAEDEGKDKV